MGYRAEREKLRHQRDDLFASLGALEGDDGAAGERERLVHALDAVAARLAELATARHLPLLSSAKIAAPCPASWESMIGTDRVRHCGVCDKEVWNLTAFDPEEAEAFLAERAAERPCIRIHRRVDGYFQDGACAPGRARLQRAATTAAALGLGAALALLAATTTPAPPTACSARTVRTVRTALDGAPQIEETQTELVPEVSHIAMGAMPPAPSFDPPSVGD